MQLAFEYRPVLMAAIDTELGEAAAQFLAFHFPGRVRVVLVSAL
jgi:hypothetical protein